MNNHQLACSAVREVLQTNVELRTIAIPGVDGFICDVEIIVEGRSRGYIAWRRYHTEKAKNAYYDLHSLCREIIRVHNEQ